MTKYATNGLVIYEGPSLLDGEPIVVVVTGLDKSSSNGKTGDMLQSWILRQDMDPREANKTGADFSICGMCKHRGIAHFDPDKALAKERTCYVLLYQAPLNVWITWGKGRYAKAADASAIARAGAGRKVRLGSYGDPAAVPAYVWDALLSEAKGHTGYSHQQSVAGSSFNAAWLMVSADTLGDAEAAWSKGQRTFRVIKTIDAVVKGKEILCPASKEAGYKTSCDKCGLCAGASIAAKSIAIVAHGNGAKYA